MVEIKHAPLPSTLPPIAVVCHPGLGGSGVVATEIAAGMANRGHAVHLVSSTPPARYTACHEQLTFHEVSAPPIRCLANPNTPSP
ncbi:MAG: hypothetical protein R3C68_06515 [Myxococcota bacterium]